MICPWDNDKFIPNNFCEPNLCGWVVQPANTWSNIGYLITAIIVLRNKNLDTRYKYWFSFIVFLLFLGSTAFHMTNTYWGRWVDVAAMLLLSGFILSLTILRYFHWKPVALFSITPVIVGLSLPNIEMGNGSKIFILQCFTAAIVEMFTFKARNISKERRTWIVKALGLFVFALVLNIMDMRKIWCLPQNHVITLHAIWHLICAYCIYLVVKFYCYQENRS